MKTLWLTTQGVNIISAAHAQSMQSIIKAFLQPFEIKLLLIATKGSSWPSISSAINNIRSFNDLQAISSDLRDVR